MKQVRFLKNSTPYNAGEIAGFSDAIANGLIATRVAEAVGASGSKSVSGGEKRFDVPTQKESKPERTKELKPEQTKGSKSEE